MMFPVVLTHCEMKKKMHICAKKLAPNRYKRTTSEGKGSKKQRSNE